MKLHLGCGQRYLEGYVNIDFPQSSHPVQEVGVADLYANILDLSYPTGTIEEVRLHHVFEHFTRPVACALLASWFSWLKPQGRIHIEVPDFRRTARVLLRTFASLKKQAVAERHIFGSHEAGWAVHCEGYTPKTLAYLVSGYGFEVLKTKKNSWRGTYNFELIAQKSSASLSRDDFEHITERLLANFILDRSDGELRLLAVWMNIYKEQVEKSWAQDG